ncbi:MAG: hypothetical protein IC227_10690 [Enterococcus lacertideformus]|uniref:Uncharacterized protein n=1 Tax=Enterococcus lacertideformus TaxID=2771493 RepID=A0A931F979_9ENTE|nr:hypothetical protein [Enterococcus lacertideformus]
MNILKLKEKYIFEKNGDIIIPVLHAKIGCKIGIEIAKSIPEVKIFFILDGINMEAVVHKNDFYNRSIMNRELRYIYRNRYSLEGKIIFFNKGEKCEAPWKMNPEL